MAVSSFLVSVLTPTCDPARLSALRRALQSVFDQTHPHVEAIVIADGPQATHVDVLEKESIDSRLRIARRSTQGGPAAARNTGARIARGDFLALLDDDDEWLPGKLETQLRLARRHPNAALIFSDTYVKTDTATVTSFSHLNFDGRPTLEALCEKDFVQPITMLVKRSVFDALGGFDESRALIGVDDYDFCLRLFTSYPAVCSREALAMYHYHGNNYSATRRFRKAETTLLRKSLRRLRNRPNCRAVLQSRLARVRRERVLQKRRFAYEAHREAYECMLKGEFKKARGALYGAMRSRPLYTKNYAYWFFACLPHAAYLAARRLKRKVWP